MDDFDLNLVTNDEVLAVNQDPPGRQGYRIANRTDSWEVWAKDLADGGKAVALFNLSGEDHAVRVTRGQLGISATVRDLWRQKNVGPMGDLFSVLVSSHGVTFSKVKP